MEYLNSHTSLFSPLCFIHIDLNNNFMDSSSIIAIWKDLNASSNYIRMFDVTPSRRTLFGLLSATHKGICLLLMTDGKTFPPLRRDFTFQAELLGGIN